MKTVAIIGAGIGGLTCALALRKFRIRADVYEAAPALTTVGAGIWMAPNAMQVFDRLGIADDVLRAGVAMNRIMVLDDRLEPIVDGDQTGVRRRFGFAITAIHRAALQQVLVRNLGVDVLHTGKRLAALRQDQTSATVTFGDGSQTTANVVIGADGLHSKTRGSILGERPLRYSGQVCWRAAVKFELPQKFQEATVECWDDRVRFGFAHIGENQVYWFAVKSAPPAQIRDAAQTKAQLVEDFRHFAQPVPGLIQAAAPEDLICTNLHDLPPRLPWAKGNVCLIGDAAHPMTPNLGQGGAQAVEDGYCLAALLATNQAGAFRKFEQRRFKKVSSIVNASYYSGALIHGAWPKVRNFVLRATPAAVANRRMESLYHLDFDEAGNEA